jgi:hypothetical protein
MEFAVPEVLLSLARSARLPGRVAQDRPWTPEDVTEMALNVAGTGYLGGGLLTGGVPKGTVLGANVWHGGPNRWMPEPGYPQGRPLLSRVGTGEGAQAYGHGFYSAESKGVGKSYADAFSDPDNIPLQFKGRNVDEVWNDSIRERWSDITSKMSEGEVDDFTTVMGNLSQVNRMEDIHNVLYNFTPAQKKMYHDLVEPKLTKPEVSASLKKLDIPDEDIAKFLDWDAPLSEQPKAVQKALRTVSDAQLKDSELLYALLDSEYATRFPDASDVRIARRMAADANPDEIAGWAAKQREIQGSATNLFEGETGGKAYARLSASLGSDQAASEALRKAGVPGLKYYDQMSRPKYSTSTLEDNIFNVKDILKNLEGKTGPQAAASRRNNLRNLKLWEQELEKTKALKQTRNYVTWDQDVLNRTRILASGGE